MDRSRMSLMTFPMLLDLLTKRLSIKDTLEAAKQSDIPCVDVMYVSKRKVEDYRRAAQETGVRIYTNIASVPMVGSERKRDRSIRKALEISQALGVKYLMIVPYTVGQMGKLYKMERQEVKKQMTEGYRAAVAMAEDYPVRVCFEATPHDVTCLSGIQDCIDVLDAVPGLEFVFDTSNMLPHGDDPVLAYEAFKGRISHVHLKDVKLADGKITNLTERTPDGKVMQCVIWGEGVIPVHMLYERMIEDGYDGQFAIEYVHPGVKNCAVKDHVQQLDRFFAKK